MVGKKLTRNPTTTFNTLYFSGQYTNSLGNVSSQRKNEYGFSGLGLIVTPYTYHYLESEILKKFDGIGIDNGMFSKAGEKAFTWDMYEKMIKIALAQEKREVLDRLHFFAIPDKPMDWKETLRRFKESKTIVQRLRGYGAPAALVIQNGCTTKDVPWGDFDVIFIGGDNEYKEGNDAKDIVEKCKEKGVTVHMGRVNSNKRINIASKWQVNSADGTYLMHELAKALHEIERRNPIRPRETIEKYHERLKRIFHGEHKTNDLDASGHITEPEIVSEFIDTIIDNQYNNWVKKRYESIVELSKQTTGRLHKTVIQELDRFLPHAPWLPQDEEVVEFDKDGYVIVDASGNPVKNREIFDALNRKSQYRNTPEGIPTEPKEYFTYINKFIHRMRQSGVMPK